MSEEITDNPMPIQDSIEVIYTELGMCLAKRAEARNNFCKFCNELPTDFAHDIGRMCDAMKNLAEVYHW